MTIEKSTILKFLDNVIGSVLCRIIGNPTLFNTDKIPLPLDKESIKKILIIRPGGLGDMIVLLPVISLVEKNFPGTVIDIICEKRNSAILDIVRPKINQLTYDTNPLKLIRKLRSTQYDIILDTEQFHNFSAVMAFWSQGARRIGFKVNPARNALYTDLVGYDQDSSELDQFKRLLKPLGCPKSSIELAGYLADISPEISRDLSDRLDQYTEKVEFALIHIGASTRYKTWPAKSFAELSTLLRKEIGLRIILLGNRKDSVMAREIMSIAPGISSNFCEPLSLADIAGLIKRARIYIGGDSGLAHLATALDVPSVILFGPSDNRKWATENNRHAIVRVDLPCSPCSIFGYNKPCRHISCMKQITAEHVMNEVRPMLH